MTDSRFQEEATAFAKKHKREIASRLADVSRYAPSPSPISVFMAGSPGAGKTEYSKNLVALIGKNPAQHPLRIDSDDVRAEIPGYDGSNSASVQNAVSIIVREMYDLALKNKQTVIFDGTLSNYDKALENIRRSLKRERPVFVFYVYQRPDVAWKFTEAREQLEGRNIPKDAFVRQFLQAGETVRRIRREFGEEVVIFLVKKDFQTNRVEYVEEITLDGPTLDDYLPERYSKEQIEGLL